MTSSHPSCIIYRDIKRSRYIANICYNSLYIYTSQYSVPLHFSKYLFALHFIRAGGIAGPVQSVAIVELSQQRHGRNTSIGDSSTCEYLPAGHSECPLQLKYTSEGLLTFCIILSLCTGFITTIHVQ